MDKEFKSLEEWQETEKLANIGLLTSSIIHEINNPIGALLTNCKILRENIQNLLLLINLFREKKDSEAERFFEQKDMDYVLKDIMPLQDSIYSSASYIKELADQIRRYGRKEVSEIVDVSINHLIEDVLNIIGRLKSKEVEIHLEFGNIPQIKSDKEKITQILINVIVNSFHATSKGNNIWIKTSLKDDNVQIEIKDDGCGIKDEHLPSIFKPFFTTKESSIGTGLGLSITKSLVEELRGEIYVKSKFKIGTTFTILLPITK